MYKLLTPSRRSDDLSFGFDRGRKRRRNELNKNESIKRIYHLTIMLKDVFGFAQNQGEATYGLGFKITLTKKI